MPPAAHDRSAIAGAVDEKSRSRRTVKLPLAARRHPFVAQLQRGFARAGVDLVRRAKGQRALPIVLGISGGADSLALLLGALAISGRTRSGQGILPIACHVHHHLRESADGDAEFVTEICERFGIRLHIEHVQPSTLKGNLAANARRLRYEALQRVAAAESAGHIAVAHHAEDQFETVLMALCRGAGPDGLAGMPWSRPLGESVSLIRPMLGVRKSDCEQFCDAAGVKWREDPSNRDTTKARARIRRDVLPILESLWPDAARRVSATAELLQVARTTMSLALEEHFGSPPRAQLDRSVTAKLPLALIAAGLRRIALHLSPQIADELSQSSAMQVAEAIQSEERRPRRFDWPGDLAVRITSKHVSIGRARDRRTGGGTRHG